MGQTLTHGVYLPDEGERNCYAGLAANWQILDTSVGTIAAHTAALAGKAPLAHTHTVSQITDFPAYGNAAGTICEGNDSRLSDARTPVAHTHGKADITDLFNSANTWSGDNTYTAVIRYKTSYTLGNPPQSSDAQQSAIMVTDSAGTNYLAQIATFQSADATGCRITIRDKFDSNGFSPSGSNRNKYFYLIQNISNQGYLKWDGYIDNSISPLANNTYNLGNSTLKWKTLNGLNPGALSLPNGVNNDTSWIGDLTILDGSNYNEKTFLNDGWVSINIPGTAGNFILINNGQGQIVSNVGTGVHLNCAITFPVRANTRVYILINIQTGEQIKHAIWTGCAGNV